MKTDTKEGAEKKTDTAKKKTDTKEGGNKKTNTAKKKTDSKEGAEKKKDTKEGAEKKTDSQGHRQQMHRHNLIPCLPTDTPAAATSRSRTRKCHRQQRHRHNRPDYVQTHGRFFGKTKTLSRSVTSKVVSKKNGTEVTAKNTRGNAKKQKIWPNCVRNTGNHKLPQL